MLRDQKNEANRLTKPFKIVWGRELTMIDVKKQLLEDLNQLKLDNSVLQPNTTYDNRKYQQPEMIIIGLEKDCTIYKRTFIKYQFIQLKKRSISKKFESWIGYDDFNGDLIQVHLCLCGRKADQCDAMENFINNRAKKVSSKNRFSFRCPSIAVIGSDGSGKSTVTTDLEKWFSKKLDCRRYYLGSGDHYNPIYKQGLRTIVRWFGRSRSSNEQQAVNTGKSQLKKTPDRVLKKGLKKGYCHLNAFYLYRISVHSLKQLKKSNDFSKNGGISLFDRFPQNQFMGINDGPKIRKAYGTINSPIINCLMQMEEKNIGRCVKMSPGLVIKLIVSPEIAVTRKPDHSILELERKADIIHTLSFRDAVIYNVDASQQYDIELKAIKKLIWNYLFQCSKTNG